MLELLPIIELGLVASAIAIAAYFWRIPYTIALVLAGLMLGLSHAIDVHLSKDLILAVFLPPLLFEGALHMDLEHLRRYATPVGLLALAGTLVSAGSIGVLVHSVLQLPWAVALLLGVMLSPTDPVSVLALFKQYGVPRGLQTVLEAESVFNDGLGIVLYLIVLEVVGGAPFRLSGAIGAFLTVACGGAAIGLGVGYLRLNRRLGAAQKAAVVDALRRGIIGEEAAAHLTEAVDAALETNERASVLPPASTFQEQPQQHEG